MSYGSIQRYNFQANYHAGLKKSVYKSAGIIRQANHMNEQMH